MQKVAIIGCGFMGRMHANVYGLLNDAQLVGVYDILPHKARDFAKEFKVKSFDSLSELLNSDVNAVDLCIPTYLHKEFTVMVANKGKHVFCEKPMALTTADADEMIGACAENNVRLMIGHCIRFWPEYALVKKLKEEKTLGELTSINMTRYGEFPTWSEGNWLADQSKAGGGALDMHIHDTDFALYLLGEPDDIQSFGTQDRKGVGQIYTTIQKDGCVAHLQGGWNLPTHTPFKMAFRAIFENGAAIFDGGPLTIYENGKDPIVPEFPRMEAAGGGNISDLGGYYHELNYFLNCLETGAEFAITTPESSRKSLEITLEEIRQVKERNR